jgi:uncharacterized repeat protein (TIGR02543 family)
MANDGGFMKKAFYLTLALCAVFFITGCADGGNDPDPGTGAGDKITITFNANSGAMADASIQLDKGAKLPADYLGTGSKIPTRAAYRFTGWRNGTTNVTANTAFSQNVTLTAQWAWQITVSFALGEHAASTQETPANVVMDSSTALGSKYPQPEPADEWQFDCWLNGETEYTSSTIITVAPPTASITLTAKWNSIYPDTAQAPDIHPGRMFAEKYPPPPGDTDQTNGLISAKVNVEFEVGLTGGVVEKGAGVLTAKWYRNTADSWEGDDVTLIYTENSKPESPHEVGVKITSSEPVAGTFYYWLEITNHNENALVQKDSTTRTMNKVRIVVTND